MVDLGKWLGGSFSIPGEPISPYDPLFNEVREED